MTQEELRNLNGRKDSCESLFETDEKEEILKFE